MTMDTSIKKLFFLSRNFVQIANYETRDNGSFETILSDVIIREILYFLVFVNCE